MPSNRRNFLKSLPAALAATAAAAASEAKPAEPEVKPEQWVHYVDGCKRCIKARVVQTLHNRARPVCWELEFEHRPPTEGPAGPVHYYQRVWVERQAEPAERIPSRQLQGAYYEQGPVKGTWHEAEGCPCGRDYGDFAYGRRRKNDADALAHVSLDEGGVPVMDGRRLEEYDEDPRSWRYAAKNDGDRPPVIKLDVDPRTGRKFTDRVKIGAVDPRTGEVIRG